MLYNTIKVYVNNKTYKFATNQQFEDNQKAIEMISNNYFQDISDVLSINPSENDFVYFSLYSNYFFAFETMFSLLAAVAQSPYFFYGWLIKYSNKDLYEIIRKISNHEPFNNPYHKSYLSWNDLAEIVYPCKNGELDKTEQNDYAMVWKKLSEEFLSKDFQDVYNSIKHGLRAKKDGILQMTIGNVKFEGSDYGFKIGLTEEIDGINLIKYKIVNIDKEQIESVFAIVSNTILNIRSFLKSVDIKDEIVITQYPLVHESVISYLNTEPISIQSMTLNT